MLKPYQPVRNRYCWRRTAQIGLLLFAKTDAGRTALRVLEGGIGEGSEELISDALNPLLRTIYNGKTVGESYSEEQIADWGYDFLVGAVLGAGGKAVDIATGENAKKNAKLRSGDIDGAIELMTGKKAASEAQSVAETHGDITTPPTPSNDAVARPEELNSTVNNNVETQNADAQKNTAPNGTESTAQEIQAAENNNAAFSNAKVQGDYSVERNDAGNVTIRINDSLLTGHPREAWSGIVKQKIQEIFSNGINLPRGTIFSNKKGRGEFTNGSYTKMLERTQPELYRAKMGMAPGTGAMVENASDVRFESPAHARADDIVGFNRGNIRVIVEGEGYTGDVLTAIYSDGKEVFFDVNNIAKEVCL